MASKPMQNYTFCIDNNFLKEPKYYLATHRNLKKFASEYGSYGNQETITVYSGRIKKKPLARLMYSVEHHDYIYVNV